MKRMQLAAAAGNALAQFNLGMMYNHSLDDNGHPRTTNHDLAVQWFLSAAKQGFPRAQLKLAQTYAEEILSEVEMPDHRIEAYAWFLRAVAGLTGAQQAEAQKGLKKAAAMLTEDEMEAARDLAERWGGGETYVAELDFRGRGR